MTTIDKKQCLLRALEVSQILKRRSLGDWPEVVDKVSTQMGMPMKVEYVQDENQEVLKINYLVPKDKDREIDDSPLEKGISYLVENQAWLNDEDRSWGANYHNQGIYLPVSYTALAHHYDETKQAFTLFEGSLFGSPFGDPRELNAALKQKPQPNQVSQNLFTLGEVGIRIGHSFQNRNRDFDGLDVISSGTSLTGATIKLLGMLNDYSSKIQAQNYDPDNSLKDFSLKLNKLASDFEQLDTAAQIILDAKGETLKYNPIDFTGDIRQDLGLLCKNIRQRQSLLIQALDSDRMPQPLAVQGHNESLEEAIANLRGANLELEALINQTLEQEQPIKTIESAISAETLFDIGREFFCGKEITHQRLFNPNLEYELQTNNLGLKLVWNANKFQVLDCESNSVCHIQRQENNRFVVVNEPSAELATILTHLPTSSEAIREFMAQSSLLTHLNAIAPEYQGKQLKFPIPSGNCDQEFCTFEFHPERITAHNPQGDLIWDSRSDSDTVLINQFSLNHLEKLAQFLSRPLPSLESNQVEGGRSLGQQSQLNNQYQNSMALGAKE